MGVPGFGTHGKVDWELAAIATILRTLRSTETGDPATLARFTATMKDLETLGFSDDAELLRKEFVAEWKGASRCTATPRTDTDAMVPSKKLIARFATPLRDAARKLSSAHTFDVDCAEFGAIVVLSDEGVVLAIVGPRKKSDPDLKIDVLENRFLRYVNKPDGLPAE